jgi:excisionase family DNA binding protein
MNDNLHEEERWLSPSEVASFFHVSPITVRSWANSGRLAPKMTPGGHRRFSMSEIKRFAESIDHTEDSNEESLETGPQQVLIVDDAAEVAGILGIHIQKLRPELEVIYAYDGFEAGALMQEYIPALIFIDIMMPGVKGDAVCRFIKRNPKARHVPVVGMTGYPSSSNIESMHAAGALAVLTKPFDLDELKKLLENVLD